MERTRGLDEETRQRTERVKSEFIDYIDGADEGIDELSLQVIRSAQAKCNDAIRLLRENKVQAIRIHEVNPRPGFDLDEVKAEIDDVIQMVMAEKRELQVAASAVAESAPAPSKPDAEFSAKHLAQHKALFDLREAGILTKREFESARRRLAKSASSAR